MQKYCKLLQNLFQQNNPNPIFHIYKEYLGVVVPIKWP